MSASRALVPFIAVPRLVRSWSLPQVALLVGAFGLAVGLGGAGAYEARHVLLGHRAANSEPTLHRLQDQIGRLQQSLDGMRATAEAARPDDATPGLKHSVEALKQDIDQVRTASAANVAQLAAKIDKVDHDPSARLAEIAARLERIEKQAAATPTPPPKPVAVIAPPPPVPRPKPVAALPAPVSASKPDTPGPAAPAKVAAAATSKADVTQVPRSGATPAPEPHPAVVGWVLRDVYDGVALVEGRNGILREVGPGQYLPGAGQVRSIERHGRNWVVLTSRGVINATF